MTSTLFSNGTIRTNLESARGPAWVLVRGDRVAAVGEDPDDAPADFDRAVDLAGGALVPGFCDAHVHLPATGIYAGGLDLRDMRSADEMLGAFARLAGSSSGVLFGGNFEDPVDRTLDRWDLDRVVGHRPAVLMRADMHSCIASSALVAELDLDDVEGVDRYEDGEPTGYLREQAAKGAWNWFETSLPRREQIDAIRAAARLAYEKGVTAVHEMFVVEWRGWGSYEVFTEAIEPLALVVRPYLGTDDLEKVRGLGLETIGGDYFLDGSFGSHTAWMRAPFASAPPPGTPSHGIRYRDDDELFAFFLGAQRAGLQVGVHAIGDAAIDQAVVTWERVAAEVGAAAVRVRGHRIEHFECATDDLIGRAARLGLRVSVQPAFDAFWGGPNGLYAARIGWERAAEMNRFRAMLDAGLVLGAGSDSTVTPLDPFLQMRALRAHNVDDQSLSGERALFLHTRGAHALSPDDDDRGAVAPGAPADLAWLDRDPVATDPYELRKTEVLGTWIGGRRVWPATEAEAS